MVPELRVVSEYIFDKSKANALTSQPFAEYIKKNGIVEIYITGADATACFKSTSYNLATMMPDAEMELPYDGAKKMLLVYDVENREFLGQLMEAMYEDLPASKKKR